MKGAIFDCRGPASADLYATSLEKFIDHVRVDKSTFKYGNDLAHELETLTEFDLSTTKPTTPDLDGDGKIKDLFEKEVFMIEVKTYMARKAELELAR